MSDAMGETEGETEGTSEAAIAGLCADCAHVRKLETKIGATIYLCGLAAREPRLPRFPRLPVIACPGFEKQKNRPPENGS